MNLHDSSNNVYNAVEEAFIVSYYLDINDPLFVSLVIHFFD